MKTLLTTLLLVISFPLSIIAAPSLFTQSAEEIGAKASCAENSLKKKIYGQQARCGSTIDEWKSYAMSLIETRQKSQTRLAKLEAVVYRNTLITQSYAHLYSMSQESFPSCGRSLLPWVGGASLGSLKSGQVMRSGLSAVAGGIEQFDQYEDGDYRTRFQNLFGPLWIVGLEQATLTLGEGNREIFRDLAWQLLAGATCGPDAVVAMIKKDERGNTDPKLKRSLQSWLLLSEAARTCDPATVILANKGFVEVEQYLVGQPVMYEGITKALGGKMLSPIVEAAMPESLGSFPSFYEHARQKNFELLISFSDADQRVAWMKDQLGVMETQFSTNAVTSPLFCAVADESETTRSYLDSVETE